MGAPLLSIYRCGDFTTSLTLFVGILYRLHVIIVNFIIVNFIIVKNTCVSHNNPFAGKRMGRHEHILLQQNLIIVKSTFVSHNNPLP